MIVRYVQICERCGRVFPREETVCPKCHFDKEAHRQEVLSAQQKMKAQHRHNDTTKGTMINEHIKVSKSGKYHVCIRCHLVFSKALDRCPRCDYEKDGAMINKYIKVSKSGKYHVCTRCNLAFIKGLDYCPRCDHFEDEDAEDDFYTSESTEQSYTACDICPHPYCNDGGWCPLLD